MKPFIPNDKFDIVDLEVCWKYVLDSLDGVDTVSAATCTSISLIEACRQAFAQARQ
jgi:uncharacterized protein with FMN-binding domain